MSRLVIATALFAATACTISETAEPNPPTVTPLAVDQAFAEADRISNLRIATGSDIPTGSVIYDGQFGADVNGDVLGSIVGDVTLEVEFNRNEVGGSIRDINLINQNGTPNQRFDGSLTVSGRESGGSIDAGAFGTIQAVDNSGNELQSDLFLDLQGDVRDDRFNETSIFGSVDGEANGDLNFDADGVFYGRER